MHQHHHAMTSASLRAAGWLCIFRGGRVIVRRPAPSAPNAWHSEPLRQAQLIGLSCTIDGGRWMDRDFSLEVWSEATVSEIAGLDAAAPHCYCSSLPGTGCDFCNGVRAVPEKIS